MIADGEPVLVHNNARFACGSDGVTTDRTQSAVVTNKKVGDAYADDIAAYEMDNAVREVSFTVPEPRRGTTTTRRQDIVDSPNPHLGIRRGSEVKVGFVENRSRIRKEIRGDRLLLRAGRLHEMRWILLRSPINGKIGMDGRVAQRLLEAGVTIEIRY
ncbi:hypothetical protein ABZ807_29260 [Micromonospora sp. NPDC047548]|uniref:hypothetical protein n=1 Tax=Micromonospora sp. NPDC047548 TaxID=3155624 RepID=UPI0033D394FB